MPIYQQSDWANTGAVWLLPLRFPHCVRIFGCDQYSWDFEAMPESTPCFSPERMVDAVACCDMYLNGRLHHTTCPAHEVREELLGEVKFTQGVDSSQWGLDQGWLWPRIMTCRFLCIQLDKTIHSHPLGRYKSQLWGIPPSHPPPGFRAQELKASRLDYLRVARS